MKKRSATPLPAPMRIQAHVIEQCRVTIEAPVKRTLRKLLIPILKRYCRMIEVGEGFQWGLPLDLAPARVGRYCYIGAGAEVSGPLTIGDIVMISTDLKVIGRDHRIDDPNIPMRLAFPKEKRTSTIIESDVFIGTRVTLMEGIIVGRGSVIAPGAIVTKDVEPYTVMAGVPATKLRRRLTTEQIEQYDLRLYGKTSFELDSEFFSKLTGGNNRV